MPGDSVEAYLQFALNSNLTVILLLIIDVSRVLPSRLTKKPERSIQIQVRKKPTTSRKRCECERSFEEKMAIMAENAASYHTPTSIRS
eukprot:scaffold35877_cov252-Amphora_coffeaeformis.AAC.2